MASDSKFEVTYFFPGYDRMHSRGTSCLAEKNDVEADEEAIKRRREFGQLLRDCGHYCHREVDCDVITLAEELGISFVPRILLRCHWCGQKKCCGPQPRCSHSEDEATFENEKEYRNMCLRRFRYS